jgi:hypothetical protein
MTSSVLPPKLAWLKFERQELLLWKNWNAIWIQRQEQHASENCSEVISPSPEFVTAMFSVFVLI